MKKYDPLIIKEFGQGFYAVLSFTGQQYNEMTWVNRKRAASTKRLQPFF